MNKRQLSHILAVFALALAAVLSVMRILFSRTALEKGIELYAQNTPAATAMHFAIALGAVLLCTVGILAYLPKRLTAEEKAQGQIKAKTEKAERETEKTILREMCKENPEAYAEAKRARAKEECKRGEARYAKECARMEAVFAASSQAVTFTGVFVGILLLLYGGMQLLEMAKTDWQAIAPLIGRAPLKGNTASAILALVHLLCALPAALYFFKAATTTGKPSAGYGVLASCPAIWCLLSTLTLYFQMDVAFNSPTKLLRLAALTVFMLWQVQEGRMLLGIPKKGLFVGFGAAAILLILTCGISDLVLYALGVISLSGGYIEAVLYIALGAYAAARMIQSK